MSTDHKNRGGGQERLTVHFLGICGTAMGAVAAAMAGRGHTVTGQDDNIYPPMSDHLRERGIPVTQGYDPSAIPAAADRIVIGNAMARGNPAVEAVLNRKLPYCSLPGLLADLFLRGRHNLVVTGTHGKTTTASLLAWILESAGMAPGWLIGGIPANLGCGANLRDAKHFVIEGDEYDTAFFDKRSKFLHYLPELVVVNNIEFDHADIFRDLEEIKTSFRHLLRIVPSEGMVLVNADDPHAVGVCKSCPAPVLEVGFSSNAGNRIHDVGRTAGGSSFTLFGERFEIPLIGDFNIRNAAMAASAAHFYGVPPAAIRAALASFGGIRRRQEVRGTAAGVTVIDDFGHHPTAIRETLSALRARHESSRLWALFEPRSNTTRRNVFQHDLPAAFANAHGVLIAEVARSGQIPPAERLDPGRVVADLVAAGKQAFYEPSPAAIVARLIPLVREGDVVVVFSNGGFGGIHEMLLGALASKK
jgi:UDP-N-acetylmuramate: L-alanyl-gamma-D-glutamyl-meso-diaminopimelate ligase